MLANYDLKPVEPGLWTVRLSLELTKVLIVRNQKDDSGEDETLLPFGMLYASFIS